MNGKQMAVKQWVKSAVERAFSLNAAMPKTPPIAASQELYLIENDFVTKEDMSRLKAGQETEATLLNRPISVTDSFWFLHSLKEIFAEETYRFRSDVESPYILDCGSNIGLSVIYFKRLFPNARIVAFEPDPHICDLLKRNLMAFGYDDVVVEDKAIWCEATTLRFESSGSLSGRLTGFDATNGWDSPRVPVATVRLRDYLHEPVDFLKIDIEGPEVEVLEDSADRLTNVENLFVEYHSDPEVEQQLDRLLSLLKNAGFRVYIKEAWNNLPLSFLRKDYNPCYDLQLNVFAYRVAN